MKHGSIGRRDFLRISAASVAGTALAEGAPAESGGPQPDPPRTIFLITIDTLRADHMGAYGYFRDTTPFLDSLAAQGTLFTNCYTASSMTAPAHVSMFTGLQLPQHKVFSNNIRAMDPRIRSLTEVLEEAGYGTAGFTAVTFLRLLDRGFDHYSADQFSDRKTYAPARNVINDTVAWLATKEPSDPLFVWVHLFDPHHPYRPPTEFRDAMRLSTPDAKREAIQYWTGDQHKRYEFSPWRGRQDAFVEDHIRYDAEIAYVDHELNRLYKYAEDKGFLENALWVVTADHGEGMGNHDLRGHSQHLYREQLHVPLIIRRTNEAVVGRKINALVHHVDLFSTMLELAGQQDQKQVLSSEGQSLVPALHGAVPDLDKRLAFSQRNSRRDSKGSEKRNALIEPVYTVYDMERKYIVGKRGKHELYDLRNDPFELVNLAEQDRTAGRELHETASARHQKLVDSGKALNDPTVTDAHDETLKALGYL